MGSLLNHGESGFKLRIANILISDSWGEVSPDALNRGIGGREGALIYLSKEWAKMGHEVTSFVNVELGRRFYEDDQEGRGYHEYVPLNITRQTLANFPWDVAIAWEVPTAFDDERIRNNVRLRICEMQVCHLSDREMVAAEENVHYMAMLSPWHAGFLRSSGLNKPKEDFVIFPNGVDLSRYPEMQVNGKITKKIKNDPKFVYSSSPDRGLWYLLQSWPIIRQEFPEAQLDVCYGVEKWVDQLKWTHGKVGEMAVEIESLIDQPGVINHGKIGQDVLSGLQMDADAWLYPLDAQSPTESGCITAIENAAAANPIITTDCDCMEGEFGEIGTIVKLPFDKDKFAEEAIKVLRDQDFVEYQREIGRAFAETRQWSVIANQWDEFFRKEVDFYADKT